jgi:hypothetical protein
MQLHTLVYRIVSLRITLGNYEDSASIRGKLEVETQKRIRRLMELGNISELEAAQALLVLYKEKLGNMPASYAMGMTRPPGPARTILKV